MPLITNIETNELYSIMDENSIHYIDSVNDINVDYKYNITKTGVYLIQDTQDENKLQYSKENVYYTVINKCLSPKMLGLSSVNALYDLIKNKGINIFIDDNYTLTGSISNIIIFGNQTYSYNNQPEKTLSISNVSFDGVKIYNVNFSINDIGFNQIINSEFSNCFVYQGTFCQTCKVSTFTNCQFMNMTKIFNLISDSKILGCYIYGGAGLDFSNGSNQNIISNTTIEWCNTYGIRIYKSNINTITSCVVDRNQLAGIYMEQSYDIQINSCLIRRNAQSQDENPFYANIVIYSSQRINICGCAIRIDNSEDDGSGMLVPLYGITMQFANECNIISNYVQGVNKDFNILTPTINNISNLKSKNLCLNGDFTNIYNQTTTIEYQPTGGGYPEDESIVKGWLASGYAYRFHIYNGYCDFWSNDTSQEVNIHTTITPFLSNNNINIIVDVKSVTGSAFIQLGSNQQQLTEGLNIVTYPATENKIIIKVSPGGRISLKRVCFGYGNYLGGNIDDVIIANT